MVDRLTVREVLDDVARQGSSPSDADLNACRAALLAPRDDGHAAWYVRVLVGFGAWVSALLFTLAAFISGIANSRPTLGALGLAAFAGGVALRRSARADFPVQLALAMSIGGRMTLYASLSREDAAVVCATALVLETVSVLVYADAVGRFLATLGACAALVGLTRAMHLGAPSADLPILAIAVAATALWQREPELLAGRHGAHQRPVGFGLVVGLLSALLVGLWPEHAHEHGRFSLAAAGLTLLLLVVERDVLRRALAHAAPRGDYRAPAKRDGDRALPAAPAPPETRAIVYGGTLAVGALGQVALLGPGLMAALLVMTLGAHRRNRLLFGLASAFLVFFGSHFYYNLSMTLLAKSGVLLGSGLLMLALRLPLARRAT